MNEYPSPLFIRYMAFPHLPSVEYLMQVSNLKRDNSKLSTDLAKATQRLETIQKNLVQALEKDAKSQKDSSNYLEQLKIIEQSRMELQEKLELEQRLRQNKHVQLIETIQLNHRCSTHSLCSFHSPPTFSYYYYVCSRF
jgi:arginine deiminase